MSYKNDIRLVDCPRDAIQGLQTIIATEKKIDYINQLIKSALFSCIDFGSFVSPKAVPQMADTDRVVDGIDKTDDTKLLAIIANERGAEIGSQYDKIDYLGYPFSISETFQQRNTNAGIQTSFGRVQRIQDILSKTSQQLVVYISMAFGNPYSDPWEPQLVGQWIAQLRDLGIRRFSIADTTAEASPISISQVFGGLTKQFPDLDFSIHLHSRMEHALPKIDAAYDAGCRRFEGAILGYGGCPFANSNLVGNIPSELLLSRFQKGNTDRVEPLLQSFRNLIAT